MYSRWQSALRYLRFYFNASNGTGHGMHSPFVYRLIRETIMDRREYPAYQEVEALRQRLLRDRTTFRLQDLGAGSTVGSQDTRSISSIARYSAKPPRIGKLLYRLSRDLARSRILELGTSLGITSAYIASASPQATMTTIEGDLTLAAKAGENFRKLGLQNVRVLPGHFDDVLPGLLKQDGEIDLVFIDGNHREEPTMRYVEQLLPKMHNDSIMILDDIHWSGEMESAWERIKAHPAARCTVDLFWIGLVFFRSEFHEKQQFRIRF